MKVLVIDDSIEYRNRWRNLLEILNHDVIEAEDGYQGIDQIKQIIRPSIACKNSGVRSSKNKKMDEF